MTSSDQGNAVLKAYQYDPPDRRKTRLFQLDLNGENDPLSGKLISFVDTDRAAGNIDVKGFFKSLAESYWEVKKKLSGDEGYIALSWVWGPPQGEEALYIVAVGSDLDDKGDIDVHQGRDCNGWIYIRPSLRDFLKEYRRRQYKKFLWIDAICLDQGNDEDKNLHIPSLRNIYENADSVFYWLGTGTPETTDAMSRLESVTHGLETCANDNVKLWTSSSWESFNLPPQGSAFWKGMREILTNPWWSRLWTLQEAVATRQEPRTQEGREEVRTFLCGGDDVPWSKIENFVMSAFRCRISDWLVAGSWFVELDNKHAFDAMYEIRGCKKYFHWGVRLNTLLPATMRRKATNPVEMVLGQTALIDRGSAQKLDLKFNSRKETVFTAFAKYYLTQEPVECLLNHIATKERSTELPSWCPNFGSSKETLSLGSLWFGDYTPDDSTFDEQFYHAGFNNNLWSKYTAPYHQTFGYIFRITSNMARGRSPYVNLYESNDKRQMRLIENTNVLRLTGMHIDTVEQIVDCNQGSDMNDFLSYRSVSETSQWLSNCLKLAMSVLSKGGEGSKHDSGFNVFVRTMTANRNLIIPEPGREMIFDQKEETDFIQRYARLTQFFDTAIKAGEAVDGFEIDGETLDFFQVLHCVTRRRRFFATTGGRIGIGPSDTAPGDEVRVVFFCPTPYLMRSAPEGRYRLVGEAYVHDLMYGEAIEMLREGKIQQTEWILQ